MLLSELAQTAGISAASIKYYRREGLLPAGTRLTATRQDYGREHVDRLQLIRVLREEAGASIPDLRQLCRVIDDPQRPVVDALEIAQALATGLTVTAGTAAGRGDRSGPPEDPMVSDLLETLGWPDISSGPRDALAELLARWRREGTPVSREVLLRYGRALGELARVDVHTLREPGPKVAAPAGERVTEEKGTAEIGEPSRDVVVARAVRGMVAYDRLTRILRALGHTSHSVLGAHATGR